MQKILYLEIKDNELATLNTNYIISKYPEI